MASFLENSSLIRHYLWKYRRLVAIGLLTLLLVDLLELVPPLLLKLGVDAAVQNQSISTLVKIAAAYLGTAIIQGVCRYGWRMYLIRASMWAGRDLRDQFSGKLFDLSASFYDRRRIGDLMSLATSDVEAVRMAIGNGFLVIADAVFYMLSVPLAMIWLSPRLTLLAFLPMLLIPWYVIRNEREVHSRYSRVQEQFSHIAALAQESLGGVRVLRAFAREQEQASRFRAAGEEYVQLSLSLARVQTAFGPTLDFTMSLGLVMLLWLGGGWTIDGVVTLGTFVAFQRYIQKMVWPMTAVGLGISFYQRAVASSSRLKKVIEAKTDVPNSHSTFTHRSIRGQQAGRIEIAGLRFAFPGTQREVIRDISLVIEPGERVAFVGSIGSGKSALLALIPRLYPVDRGMIRVDGVDINDWPIDELRQQVGYVSQDVFLFSESVSENVAFGIHDWITNRDSKRDRETRIREATQMASVHEDVLGLASGYATRLGERGVNLSGGQKQRLTLARALSKDPPILILDDALSSVDVRTEERILEGLRSRPGRNTELIAAHRVSTIRLADRIVVLDEGSVRQSGKWDDLMKDRSGPFSRLCEQQRLRDELERYVEEVQS